MRSFLRNLVIKVRLFLARGASPGSNPVTSTVWESIPFDFGTDWFVSVKPEVTFPHTAVCRCYYCRVRLAWAAGDNSQFNVNRGVP